MAPKKHIFEQYLEREWLAAQEHEAKRERLATYRRIEITPRHIAKGLPKSCTACPAALALREAGFVRAAVSCSEIVVSHGMPGGDERIERYYPSEALIEFIRAYDKYGPHSIRTPKPMAFEL